MNYVPTKDAFLCSIYAFQVFENHVHLTLREGRRRKTEGVWPKNGRKLSVNTNALFTECYGARRLSAMPFAMFYDTKDRVLQGERRPFTTPKAAFEERGDGFQG